MMTTGKPRQIDPVAAVIAALTGATAWISAGTLAVTSERGMRLGALPPLWALPALVAAALAVAAMGRVPRRAWWPFASTIVLWLPWLPLQSVPAFLLWEGPLETVVWIAAIAGAATALAPQWEGPALPLLDRRRVSALVAAAAATSIAGAALLARDGEIPGGDEPHYLIITQSLLYDHDLRIENNHDRGDYLAYYEDEMPPDFLQRGRDGEIYSVHAPGVSVLVLPAFAAGGYPAAVVLMAIVTAAGLALAAAAAAPLAGTPAALIAAAAVFGTAPVFFHSFTIFPDPAGAAAIAAALLLLVRLQHNAESVGRGLIAAGGVAAGLLPFLHTRFAVVSAAIGIVVAARLWQRRDRAPALTAFAVGPVVLALAWFGYFQAIYGTLNPAAPYGNSRQSALEWIPTGLAGLSVDQQFGLALAAPVLLFVPYGLLVLARTAPRLAAELIAIALPYTLVVASFGMWWGGRSGPGRFLVCLMPLAVPVLGCAWRSAGRSLRAVFVALVLLGVANIAARLLIDEGRLLYNTRDGADLLLDWLSAHADLPLAFPSVHRSGAAAALRTALGWLAIAGLAIAALHLLLETLQTRGARWAATTAAGYAALMAGAATAWQLSGAAAITPAPSQAAFVRRWNAERRSVVVRLPSLRRIDVPAVAAELDLGTSTRARRAGAEAPLLAIERLPPGQYHLAIEGAGELAGVLTAVVGTASPPLEVWRLDGVRSGITGLRLQLPSAAHALAIDGDAAARARIRRVSLRPDLPLRVENLDPAIVRAARYGSTRAYFLDNEAFVEPFGVWTRGGGTTRFVLRPDPPAAVAIVEAQSGPMPVRLAWSAGDRHGDVQLKAGERRQLQLPAAELVTLRTEGAFRPVDVDAGSGDRRRLGVRLEFPSAQTTQ